MTRDDPRFVRAIETCLALPEATRHDQGPLVVFKVRGRTFAHLFDDYQGQGIAAIAGRAPWSGSALGRASGPARYSMPSFVHRRGWLALRLDQEEIAWSEVAALVAGSYRLIAARPLVLQMEIAGWLGLSEGRR